MRTHFKMDKFTNTPTEIDTYVEILHKQLYFAILKGTIPIKLKNNIDTVFFSIDDELVYQNYYSDFGPLNISCLYKYCFKLNKYLQYARGFKSVVHYTCNNSDKKANAACLMGCFCVIFLNSNPKDVWRLLQELGSFKPFLDASQYPCGYTLRILDVLQAIYKAMTFNFFNFSDFNVTEYELYDKLQYGDMNWLIPRKFLAFIGPADNGSAHSPEFYIKYFLKNDIKTVIRLNTAVYDPTVFTNVGIHHFDLIFPDGATPPREVLLKFLAISEMAPAAVAVHCKAGLGRTGSLIGAYLIKHYRMSSREAIGWMRLCRPGSVIGQQQIWLEKIESWLWRSGSQYRVRKYGAGDKIPRHKYGIYSKQWPLERERLIADARNKLQKTFTKSQIEKIARTKKLSLSVDSLSKSIKPQRSLKKLLPVESNSYKSVSKLLTSIHGIEKNADYTAGVEKHLKDKSEMKYVKHKPEIPHNTLKYSQVAQRFSQEKDKQDKFTSQGDKLNEKKVSWYQSKILGHNIFTRR